MLRGATFRAHLWARRSAPSVAFRCHKLSLASAARNEHHDVGGALDLLSQPLPKDAPTLPWELECHALFAILSSDGVLKTDMLRRGIESLPLHAHEEWSYYERWVVRTASILREAALRCALQTDSAAPRAPSQSAAMASLLREVGHIAPGELEAELVADDLPPNDTVGSAPRFSVGDRVVVRREERRRTAWRAPHLRTPGYIFGCTGIIERHAGDFADPSLLAFGVPVRVAATMTWPCVHLSLGALRSAPFGRRPSFSTPRSVPLDRRPSTRAPPLSCRRRSAHSRSIASASARLICGPSNSTTTWGTLWTWRCTRAGLVRAWHLVAPVGTRRHRTAHDGTRRRRAAPSGTWRHLAARSSTQRHAAARSGTQRHAVGCSVAS